MTTGRTTFGRISLSVKLGFLFLYLVFQLAANAELPSNRVWWDSSFYTNTRNYPLGLAVGTQWGLGVTAWDATKSSSVPEFFKSLAYGYVRAQGRVQTSGVVNSGDLRLEVFPVSFAGFIAGRNMSLRASDFSGVDCVSYSCRGSVDRQYWALTAALGAGGLSVLGYLRNDKVNLQDLGVGVTGFYDEASSLNGASDLDNLRNWDLVAAYKLPFAQSHRVGLIHSEYLFSDSANRSQSSYGFWAYTQGKFLWQLGMGQYSSSLQSKGFSAFAGVKWVPKKGASLL